MKLSCLILLSICITFTSTLFAQQEQVYARRTALWRSNQIAVSRDNPTSENQHGRELVRKAIEESWGKYSALRFIGWDLHHSQITPTYIFTLKMMPHILRDWE